MSSSAVFPLHRYAIRSTIPNLFNCCQRRHRSSSRLEHALRTKLIKRKSPPRLETLNPHTSSALSKILSTYLPESCQARKPPLKKTEDDDWSSYVPQGHHQVFFNNVHSEDFILPDGTDKEHYPGAPFEQRLWAGGCLTCNPKREYMMRYDKVTILQEDIEHVRVKGKEGQEKVFVTISRKFALYSNLDPQNTSKSDFPPDFRALPGVDIENGNLGPLAMEEKKVLVFVRVKTEEERKQSLESVPRIIKPVHKPDFSLVITPTAHLLSRFSALTFNAHRIHLDRQYCREVEGHRNLLVHGQLSQVLMLSVLRSQFEHNEGGNTIITRFDYKNLAPLYVDEPMCICVRRHPDNHSKFDVWIQGPDEGYAVKAKAEVAFESKEQNSLVEGSLVNSDENDQIVQKTHKMRRLNKASSKQKPQSELSTDGANLATSGDSEDDSALAAALAVQRIRKSYSYQSPTEKSALGTKMRRLNKASSKRKPQSEPPSDGANLATSRDNVDPSAPAFQRLRKVPSAPAFPRLRKIYSNEVSSKRKPQSELSSDGANLATSGDNEDPSAPAFQRIGNFYSEKSHNEESALSTSPGPEPVEPSSSDPPVSKPAAEQLSDLISVIKDNSPSRKPRKDPSKQDPKGWDELHPEE